MLFSIAIVLVGILLGSAVTIQVILIPLLMGRVQDRSTVTRISNDSLKRHHMIAVLLLVPSFVFFWISGHVPATIATAVLLLLNLYQRFWTFTKMHLVKQPIGVQDLIQPDNVLREEFNKLQRRVYFCFRLHLCLLFIDLVLAAI